MSPENRFCLLAHIVMLLGRVLLQNFHEYQLFKFLLFAASMPDWRLFYGNLTQKGKTIFQIRNAEKDHYSNIDECSQMRRALNVSYNPPLKKPMRRRKAAGPANSYYNQFLVFIAGATE